MSQKVVEVVLAYSRLRAAKTMPVWILYGRLQKMALGRRATYACVPSFCGFGLEHGHVPGFHSKFWTRWKPDHHAASTGAEEDAEDDVDGEVHTACAEAETVLFSRFGA